MIQANKSFDRKVPTLRSVENVCPQWLKATVMVRLMDGLMLAAAR
jgi:hypothetical protein